jgi:hypothetical protein
MPVAAIILPNGQIRHLSQEWGDCPCETSTKPVAYENTFAEYPDCYAVPFRCVW